MVDRGSRTPCADASLQAASKRPAEPAHEAPTVARAIAEHGHRCPVTMQINPDRSTRSRGAWTRTRCRFEICRGFGEGAAGESLCNLVHSETCEPARHDGWPLPERPQRSLSARRQRGSSRGCSRDITPWTSNTQLRVDHASKARQVMLRGVTTMLFFLSLAGTCGAQGSSLKIIPKWMWNVSLTKPLLDTHPSAFTSDLEGNTIEMPHYACTKDSSRVFAPNAKSVGGFDCGDSDCITCKALCANFDYGGNAVITPSSELVKSGLSCEGTTCGSGSSGYCITNLDKFPATCLPRLQTLEGQFSPLGTWFHFSLNASEAIGPEHVGGTEIETTVFMLKMTYRWGFVDVYGSRNSSFDTGKQEWTVGEYAMGLMGTMESYLQKEVDYEGRLAEGLENAWELSNETGTLQGNDIKKVVFGWTGDRLTKIRSLAIIGTFAQIKAAMMTMTFMAEPGSGELPGTKVDMNSYRLRHYRLSPASAKEQPWFQIEFQVTCKASCDEVSIGDGNVATFLQQVWVVPVNNRPVVVDPQEGHLAGCLTSPALCNTEYGVFENPRGVNYYFGQYWRWEGTSDPLLITGLAVDDVDLDEDCGFDAISPCKYFDDPVTSYKCGKMDVTVRAQIGTINLNSRTIGDANDLKFHTDEPKAKGFTSVTRFMSQAIGTITYRVDTPENVVSGTSEVIYKNTQYENADEEYLQIDLSDQGLFSDTGEKQVAIDKQGNDGLKIRVTIAAKNNAPTLSTPPDFTVFEDIPFHMEGLEADDVDADEVTNSPLALKDWLTATHNSVYLNKLRITVELKGYGNDKGRGLLYLNSDARELWIVSTDSQVFVSVRSGYIENYACNARSTIFRPGKYVCGQGSTPSMRGQPCRGDWDLKTCSFVAAGTVQAGSTDTSVVIAGNKTALDAYLANRLETFEGEAQKGSSWTPQFRLEITDGPGRGTTGQISEFNLTTLKANLRTGFRESRGIPPPGSSWAIYLEPQTAKCEYIGTNLQTICAKESCLHKDNEDCTTAEKCCCVLQDSCSTDGQYRLHLNFTRKEHKTYITELVDSLQSLNKTCGGLPLRNPLYFSSALSKRCNTHDECSQINLVRCVPGVTCKCCGNLTATCSSHDDCSDFANPFEKKQFCGCTSGYDAPMGAPMGTGLFNFTDRVCCASALQEPHQGVTKRCTTDRDCDAILNGSKCGCAAFQPVCGPYTQDGQKSGNLNVGFGQACTYRFPEAATAECESSMFAFEGTKDARIFGQLLYFQKAFENRELAGKGSTRIEFYGQKQFAQLALRGLRYLTYNPNYEYYNRLYRLPPEERDPTTFKIDANDYDLLVVTADDMGNSGGSIRDVKTVTKSLPVIVRAVNNGPKLSAPPSVEAVEDTPLHIINDLSDPANPLYGINITDPDQSNFGFNDPRMVFGRSLGFMVNLSVSHGCLFVNESYLRYGPEYAERSKNKAVVGGPDCALDKSFDIGGCTIRLKDYGQPKAGLHAVRCTDPQCLGVEMAPCYSDTSPSQSHLDGKSNKHCYGGRACTKILAFEGRFPDVNKLLANVTYLSDPDFNTGYGYTEKLEISISDNGIIGDPEFIGDPRDGIRKDPPITVYTDSISIPIAVKPVNDAPVIGRLQKAKCVDLKDDGTVNLADERDDLRLFAINPTVDRIDVNEDTEFTIMPDRLWIADVDAEEAETRSSKVTPRCAGQCGSVQPRSAGGCCIKAYCPDLCSKMMLVSDGAVPSDILVEFKVQTGKISFFPPSTRKHIRGITFMTNISTIDIKAAKTAIEPCSDQTLCARNQSRIWIRARLPKLQQAMQEGFLRYVGKENWAGNDVLQVWVSDDGYTEPANAFSRKLTAEEKLGILVVAINDDPGIVIPGGEGCKCDPSNGKCSCSTAPPLQYTKGILCRNDWMKYGFTDPWPKGRALECKQSNLSKIPNDRPLYDAFPELSNKVVFSDVDMDETPHGNITVTVKIERPNAGSFTIKDVFSSISYYQWIDADEMLNLRMQGKLTEINIIMTRLFFDAKEDYSGSAPFQITIVDNNNFGICRPKSGQDPYQCNRAHCENIFSGVALENKFVCGKPVGADNSIINFLPGGSIPCNDVRLQPNQCKAGCRGDVKQRNKLLCEGVADGCSRIIVRESGQWSGPWSCLGCGYYNPDSRQVESVDESNPSVAGLQRATVDVLVGGAAACKFDNCLECNAASRAAAEPHGTGCGWCPSFCGGAGKCIIEVGGVPLFETCPRVAGFRGYRQCRDPPSNVLFVAVLSGLAVLSSGVLLYIMIRWLQRRHGSLVVWLKKKQFDITYHGRKLWLVPAEGANYILFSILVTEVLVAGLLLSGVLTSPSGPFHFQEEIYLDSLTSMNFELDNCNVRFMPTRNYPAPTSKIEAVKIRFAFYKHKDIVLKNDACSPSVRLKLENRRSPATKYTNFYCNVEILIPDRYVVPSTVIEAIGTNLTTVRSGPMDVDTLDFGLDFGPNEFIMKGERIDARIDNFTAKHLKYDVKHGSLLATNITYTPFGTFNSLTADMSVTSTRMTTVHFWQKSSNLMCLSAATLFVDSTCKQVCDFATQGNASSAPVEVVQGDPGKMLESGRYYRRKLNVSSSAAAASRRQSKQCADPDTEKLRLFELKNGQECLTDCKVVDSARCRCKPQCDMKPPDELEFNGFKGVKGACNEEGKCCRTLCGSYSRADLFPFPNSVRCGVCVPATKCSMPQCGLWDAGKLEQQWWFTSVSGQMSLAVVDHSIKIYNPDAATYSRTEEAADPSAWHVYKPLGLSQPHVKDPMSNISLDFTYQDKVSLDSAFHPGGESSPKQEWFWLRTAGPGAPPISLGSFLWVQKVKFLVIPDYFLQVVSNGMLSPKKSASSALLRPGFCPAVLKEYDPLWGRIDPSINKRIIQIQQLLERTLQDFPVELGDSRKILPDTSLIAWLPAMSGRTFQPKATTSKFQIDPKTNEIGFVPIDQWRGAGNSLFLMIILGSLVVPLTITIIFVIYVIMTYRAFVADLREKKIKRENTVVDIYEQARLQQMSHYDREEKLTISPSIYHEMTARTSFFYIVDLCLGQGEVVRAPAIEVVISGIHVVILAIPVLYINYVAGAYEAGFKAYHCENVINKGKCYSRPELISSLLNYGILGFTIISVLELSCYYLRLPYNFLTRILRYVFYSNLVVFASIALWLLLMNATWIFLGVLIKPSQLAPYPVGAISIVWIACMYYSKLMRFRQRVSHQTNKRLVIFASKLGEKFPKGIIEHVLEGNLEIALGQHGLSRLSFALKTAAMVAFLSVMYAFIFVGFQAFTDPTDPYAALINVGIVLATAMGFQYAVSGDSDKDWNEEQTQAMCQQVLLSMQRVFQVLQDQLHLAEKIVVQQRKEMHRQRKEMLGAENVSSSSSEEEEGDTDGSTSDTSGSYTSSASTSSDFSSDGFNDGGKVPREKGLKGS